MKRSAFLKTILPTGLALGLAKPLMAKRFISAADPVLPGGIKVPRYLRPGDTISITCPASAVDAKDLEQCKTLLEQWGYRVKYGNTVGQHWQRFGGTDAERAADVQRLLDDSKTDAIMFGRGGYGIMRMMDKLNWSGFLKHPKWLIGFSDITAFHCHAHSALGVATLHADMGSGIRLPEDDAARSLKRALSGQAMRYHAPAHKLNRYGTATAPLVGGNLSLIYAMQGSKSALQTDGKILLIEDVSEYKYTVDRMMMNLKRSGKLDNLAGLVVGGFTATKEDTETSFNMTMEEVIFEKVQGYSYPVCFNFPSGHQKQNMALKLGCYHQFEVLKNGTSLSETLLPSAPATGIDTLKWMPDSTIIPLDTAQFKMDSTRLLGGHL
ncbi:MAG: LD-carboxypeptidase [Bacteroidetes bacterium]|nr:MAG: LD-carboxypeptidase [Bacteroidota bacterium]